MSMLREKAMTPQLSGYSSMFDTAAHVRGYIAVIVRLQCTRGRARILYRRCSPATSLNRGS